MSRHLHTSLRHIILAAAFLVPAVGPVEAQNWNRSYTGEQLLVRGMVALRQLPDRPDTPHAMTLVRALANLSAYGTLEGSNLNAEQRDELNDVLLWLQSGIQGVEPSLVKGDIDDRGMGLLAYRAVRERSGRRLGNYALATQKLFVVRQQRFHNADVVEALEWLDANPVDPSALAGAKGDAMDEFPTSSKPRGLGALAALAGDASTPTHRVVRVHQGQRVPPAGDTASRRPPVASRPAATAPRRAVTPRVERPRQRQTRPQARGDVATTPRRDTAAGRQTRSSASTPNLTGTWTDRQGAVYHLRHEGDRVWWHATGTHADGTRWVSVYAGEALPRSRFRGEWADVPSGASRTTGVVELTVGEGGAWIQARFVSAGEARRRVLQRRGAGCG